MGGRLKTGLGGDLIVGLRGGLKTGLRRRLKTGLRRRLKIALRRRLKTSPRGRGRGRLRQSHKGGRVTLNVSDRQQASLTPQISIKSGIPAGMMLEQLLLDASDLVAQLVDMGSELIVFTLQDGVAVFQPFGLFLALFAALAGCLAVALQ